MKRIKIGSMCRCKKHPECFFEPGSVVVITGYKSTIYLVKLMFGSIKQDANPRTLAANTDADGSVQCLPSELEPFNEPSHVEKES